MTQLGELQGALPDLGKAGIKPYAISYDSPRALAAFASVHGITYSLLSDPDSEVIRRYGILNTLIDPSTKGFYGIPYPGTYVVDESGVVTEKFFHRNLVKRESVASILDSVLGQVLIGDAAPCAEQADEGVNITAFLRGDDLKAGIARRLYVRFELREGLHIYSEPVPEGWVATHVAVKEIPGLVIGEPILPPTKTLRLEALGIELETWSGTVDIAIPLMANSTLAPILKPLERKSICLEVSVRYQACDDKTCLIPRNVNLELEIPIVESTVPNVSDFEGASQNLTSMDTMSHMLELFSRERS